MYYSIYDKMLFMDERKIIFSPPLPSAKKEAPPETELEKMRMELERTRADLAQAKAESARDKADLAAARETIKVLEMQNINVTTGLPNGVLMKRRLDESIRELNYKGERESNLGALMVFAFDIDSLLKQINDY